MPRILLLTALTIVASIFLATTEASAPIHAAGESGQTLSAGIWHACTLKDGTDVVCWGLDVDGQVSGAPADDYTSITVPDGVFTCALAADSTIACWGSDAEQRVSDAPAGLFTSVASGEYRSCAVAASDGHVECWGTPVAVPSGSFTQVSSSYQGHCGIKTDQSIECWGGLVSTPPTGTFTQVSWGGRSGCAIRTDQTVACWGDVGGATPTEADFLSVSANSGTDQQGHFACGIREGNIAECWGSNAEGQLDVPSGSYSEISAGVGYACAKKVNGGIVCWGDGSGDPNLHGQVSPPPEVTDQDDDSVMDDVDNCPYTPNPGQENMDGDQWGDACEYALCRNVATVWVTPNGDDDCDHWTTADETAIGTNAGDPCGYIAGGMTPSEVWPPDLIPSDSVTISDVLALKPRFNTTVPPTDVRYDLVPDGSINISDVLALKSVFNWPCTP